MSWWGYKRKSVAPVTQPRTVARESECNNDRGGGQLEIRTRAEGGLAIPFTPLPSSSCVEAALVEELKSVGVDGKQKGEF
ncbi:hypothetical protein OPV22_004750 [Ensete ventricosum]|uniref:Uncharacterized protein n=1 Tax=Ensete ventricosum TaxID=4639 RepID=A0AAV8RKN9_ENSVE|nr:hypothetical protein OPV22_004750 [Ensete ventricosum]